MIYIFIIYIVPISIDTRYKIVVVISGKKVKLDLIRRVYLQN